jgi:hypothetical protein
MSIQNNWCVAVKLPVFSGLGDQHSGVTYQCLKNGMTPEKALHVSLYVAKGLTKKQHDQIVQMFDGFEANVPKLPAIRLPLQRFASKCLVIHLDRVGEVSEQIRGHQQMVGDIAKDITGKPHMYSPFRPHISVAKLSSDAGKLPQISLNQEVVFGRGLSVASWQE